MKRFVIVNIWKPLTIITKRSILDAAAVLDLPLGALQSIELNIQIDHSVEPCVQKLRRLPFLMKKTI